MTALVVAPVLLLVLQPYGGEMVLRVFFFSLPFLAFYAARAFRGLPGNRRMWKPVAGMTLALILLLAFYVTRYGNARLDVFSDQETQAIAELYDQAPGGSLILAVVDSLPWKDRRYEVLDHKTLNRIVIATLDPRIFADAAAAAMYGDRSRTSYFVATSSQQTYIELLGGAPPNTLGVVEDLLRNDPNIDLIVDEPDVRIYELPTTEVEQ